MGYKTKGYGGLIATVLGTAIPSFVTILLIAFFFADIRTNPVVERIFCGIRPAVVALIVVPVVNMLKKSEFKWEIVTLALLSAVAVWEFSFATGWHAPRSAYWLPFADRSDSLGLLRICAG